MRVLLIFLLLAPALRAGDEEEPQPGKRQVPAVTERCAELSDGIEELLEDYQRRLREGEAPTVEDYAVRVRRGSGRRR